MDERKLSPLLRRVLEWLEPHVNDVEHRGEEDGPDNDNQGSRKNDDE